MPDYFDLGNYAPLVTTDSDLARTWVQRGLIWAYAFNHDEAVACFEKATLADPSCALAYWGIAYSLGPNYNKPWEAFEPDEARMAVGRARAAAVSAREHAAGASAAEQALIGALAARYPQDAPAGDWSGWNRDYADAMRTAYHANPADVDVAALFADALLNLTPWALWDTSTGQPAVGAFTVEARTVLEDVLASSHGRLHPGALHLYIHLMEMSPCPEDALWAGELLRDLVPDAGHLRHMPTHLDVLCGDYRQVVASNAAAIAADERFVAVRGEMNFYTLYRAHNYHFVIYGAMFLGQFRVALETADALAAVITEDLLRMTVPPMADWLEGFVAMRVHVLIRFGRWQDLIGAALPSDADLYRVTTAMLHYGKGVAYAATGQVENAREERELFAAAVARVPESRMIFNNTCQAILAVARAMLDGEVEYRAGNATLAFEHLRRAVALDDALPYDEPWGWMQPARHAYGALLLEKDLAEEAEAVYRADLGLDPTLPRPCQHPGNVWSLHGYHECLNRLGKHEQAAIIAQQLRIAVARADIPVTSSCFCRTAPEQSANQVARLQP